MLFKPEHVPMILNDTKTETRRIWKSCHVKVGNVYQAKTQMISKDFFAKIKVLKVWQEKLSDITEESAKREGYPTREVYFQKFDEINGNTPLWTVVYAIRFERVK